MLKAVKLVKDKAGALVASAAVEGGEDPVEIDVESDKAIEDAARQASEDKKDTMFLCR